MVYARMLVLFVLPLAMGCGTQTSTTHLWQAEGRPRVATTVLAFAGGMTEPMRRSVEDRLAHDFSERGARATPSYRIFPQLPQRQIAQDEVKRLGFDAAIVATLRAVNERQTYVPGYYHGGFWGGYYGPGWGMSWSPGYVVTDEYVNVETTFWDLRQDPGNLVWTSNTVTRNPTSSSDFAESFADEIFGNLESGGLVRKK